MKIVMDGHQLSKRRKANENEGKKKSTARYNLEIRLETVPSKIATNLNMVEDAKIIVGIDFGTTFSGFAYALATDAEKVFTFYDWPSHAAAGAKPYCKTQTSLWYLPGTTPDTFNLQDWGWPAFVNHSKVLQMQAKQCRRTGTNFREGSSASITRDALFSTCGHFLTKFKLLLAAPGSNGSPVKLESDWLPEGLSVERIIADYLQHLGAFIMEELKNKFGGFILKKDIQWCLTVPVIWDQAAKQSMINCAQIAGLVQGPRCRDWHASVHPLLIVLEPEAASVYCQQKLQDNHFVKGSRFLVVDAGGGTVDLVVHEKVYSSGVKVKEVACSTGDLCGGTFVDKAFMQYLARKISCFEEFSIEFPATVLTIKGYWENFKCSFDGRPGSYDLELPAKLAAAWEAHQKPSGSSGWMCYDELVITSEDMKSIFDGEVSKILKLIADQLAKASNVEAIMVVGGFSNSPSLMKKIREKFSRTVMHIMSPTDPGSTVCQGAVAFGASGAEIMMSRRSRRTYGIASSRSFRKGDPQRSMIFDDAGRALCGDAFYVFTRVGDEVPVNHDVQHPFVPVSRGGRKIDFTMYSTSEPYPEYVTDIGVVEVGSWSYPLPVETQKMKDRPSVLVSMYFGRTQIFGFLQNPKISRGRKCRYSLLCLRGICFEAQSG